MFNFMFPKNAFSQLKDLNDNDNKTPEMEMREARELVEWAASKRGNKAWDAVSYAAQYKAAQTFQRYTLKAV